MTASSGGSGMSFALTAVLLVCQACQTAPPPAPEPSRITSMAAAAPESERQAPRQEGSLWRDRAELGDLYSTKKARRVGDILTVRVVESSSATNQAATRTDRESDINAGLTNFLNLEKYYPAAHVPGNWPYLNPFGAIRAEMRNEFDASGTTRRSGNLAATITVRVMEEMPGGRLKIAGSREVLVNNERQYITLTGMIRSADVDWDNTILSTCIADARITYSGVGVLNDRQRPGWGTRLLDLIWPF